MNNQTLIIFTEAIKINVYTINAEHYWFYRHYHIEETSTHFLSACVVSGGLCTFIFNECQSISTNIKVSYKKQQKLSEWHYSSLTCWPAQPHSDRFGRCPVSPTGWTAANHISRRNAGWCLAVPTWVLHFALHTEKTPEATLVSTSSIFEAYIQIQLVQS